jgi:hypothetical protein
MSPIKPAAMACWINSGIGTGLLRKKESNKSTALIIIRGCEGLVVRGYSKLLEKAVRIEVKK